MRDPRVSFGLPVPTLTAPSDSIALLATTTDITTTTTAAVAAAAAATTTATVTTADDDAVGSRCLSIFPRSLRGRSTQTVDVCWVVLTSLLSYFNPFSHLAYPLVFIPVLISPRDFVPLPVPLVRLSLFFGLSSRETEGCREATPGYRVSLRFRDSLNS